MFKWIANFLGMKRGERDWERVSDSETSATLQALVEAQLVDAGPRVGEGGMSPECARAPDHDPTPPRDGPRLSVGTLVRLKHKPDRVRRILGAEWHFQRKVWTYIVETRNRGVWSYSPKFSEEELVVEGDSGIE